jgi:nucleoside-diphosphate-sugar epimerase
MTAPPLGSLPAGAVGIVGGRSPVGRHLLRVLSRDGWAVTAFSRADVSAANAAAAGSVTWQRLPPPSAPPSPQTDGTLQAEGTIAHWIFAAHIWSVPDYFGFLEARGIRHLVALSSTSRFTKTASSDIAERDLARRLSEAEDQVLAWAAACGVTCTILRPTLIYGGGDDRNLSEVAAFIRKFGFFPLLGKADGQRQPIHVEDVAGACVAALKAPPGIKSAYNISGAEILTYREMVERVFAALGRPPRLVPVPLPAVKAGVWLARRVPRYRHWSPGMAERMVKDMVFDHTDATRDFGFRPRPFRLSAADAGG